MPRLPRSRLLPVAFLFALCLLLPSFALAGQLSGVASDGTLAPGNGSVAVVGGERVGSRQPEGAVLQPSEGDKVADNVPETVPTLSQAKANTASASSATGYSQDQRASPAPELPIFVLQSPSQMVATVAHSSGLPRRAIARVDAVVNPAQDPATSGVVSFVCKSIGLLVTLVVTAVVVFLASGPGL